jgi:hypothetical protein
MESRQVKAISYQLSAVSYQLSAISYQLSAISYQLSAISQKRGGQALPHHGAKTGGDAELLHLLPFLLADS